MKRSVFLLIGIVLLAGLGWYAFRLINKSGGSDVLNSLHHLEITDTAKVDRMIITEPSGAEIEVIRQNGTWTDKNGNCIQVGLVNSILDATYNAHFKGYVPDNATKTVINRIATTGTKVQFFSEGSWNKTWYIGSATADHEGTYMIVESDEYGKCDVPGIVELKNMKGIISPRFFADSRKWECTNIFNYELNELAEVDVKFMQHPERNFNVKQKGYNYEVIYAGKRLPQLDTSLVTRYLLKYKKINFELPNYELTDRQVDSVKKSTPFCVLKVKTVKGDTKTLRMFRRKSETGELEVDDFGDQVKHDINSFWCQLPNGNLVKCQYFVFNHILMGNVYFNYRPANTVANTR